MGILPLISLHGVKGSGTIGMASAVLECVYQGWYRRPEALNRSTQFPQSLKTVSEYKKDRKTSELAAIKAAPQADFATNDAANSIQAALDYFDNESQLATPTCFVPEGQGKRDDSALAAFMSKAADIESVFEFEDKSPQVPGPGTLGAQLSLVAGLSDLGSKPQIPAGQYSLEPEETFANNAKRSMSMFDQTAVLKDPLETSGVFTCTIERDNKGRVVRALYIGGEFCRFQYGENGELTELYYAGLSWKLDEEGWFARDRQTDYRVEGTITVLSDGCIQIEKDDVVRTLKHSGTRIDEHKSGSRTESRKLKNLPSPYDLLAKAKPVNSLWLNCNSKRNTGERLILHTPMPMDVINQLPDSNFVSNAMIPAIADVAPLMDTGNFQSVNLPILERSERPDKLRELEDQLAISEQDTSCSMTTFKREMTETYLKACLWVMDRVKGPSSQMHLQFLDRLAELYFSRQRNEMAELTHLRALHIRERLYGAKQPDLATNVSGLARINESRGNMQRAEELYKEAVDLQEMGLRKNLFLYSEKVIDGAKLAMQVEPLFSSMAELVRFFVSQRKVKEAAAVQSKAVQLFQDMSVRESASLRSVLSSIIEPHLLTMKEIISARTAA